ncbi:tRNA (adenine-N1)-methyltransferase [Agrococcus carbonis]|uniref:tRNA (Adenine-58-N(1)-) methyltransferase n=1 Tax=Agrococcus carbonis TaxID=684552 RepID=A0A1H1KW92_9MICO|nr:tRNA (adenine-58-N(1)-) methyltransferase [Agrococcus carbonis]
MMGRTGPLQWGDVVQLTGPKQRMYTIVLTEGKQFGTQHGAVPHAELVGLEDGSLVTVGEAGYLAIRPLLHDYVMSMPRGAAIIYPKDASHIVGFADIHPDLTVVEAGVGSGALSLWLLRALHGTGRLVSFERREEFRDVAEANVTGFFGERPANWETVLGDLADELDQHVPDGGADRVLLDMLAPWECVDATARALRPGGLVLCYVATVTQLSRTVEAIRADGRFTAPKSTETLVRGWHVEGLAVRPDHRMVAHTGFLMTARRVADGVELPSFRRRAAKADFAEADIEAWTPGALGDRVPSDKRARRARRDAQRQADAIAAGGRDAAAEPSAAGPDAAGAPID